MGKLDDKITALCGKINEAKALGNEVVALSKKLEKLKAKKALLLEKASGAALEQQQQQQQQPPSPAQALPLSDAKKGKKSKKRKQADADGTAAGGKEGAEETGKAKKKAKKEKKSLNGAAKPEASAEEVVSSETGAQETGKSNKKAKKEKKSKDGAAEPAASAEEVASALQALASVGDANLARSGKKIIKALYKEHPEVKAMTAEQVSKLRKERETVVEGMGAENPCAFKPLPKFAHTGLPPNMLHATREFASPSPIQSQCWPIIQSGRDLIGIASTGSGKTLGFGLPMMAHITKQKEAGVVGKGKGPFAVVMAPTRELALQINQVLEDAGSKCGIHSLCVYGGVPKKEQIDSLRRGTDVVVGTPGRMEDLMNDNILKLNEVTYLVLDEADRMLDLGFEPHIRAICSHIRSDRQTMMFSATWPTGVQQLAAYFMTQPVKVVIGSQDLAASHSITQHVEVIDLAARDDRLLQLLRQYHSSRSNRIMIFVLYKKEAPRVESLLNRKGFSAAAIHGDINQAQRTAAVEGFKSGKIPLLIATDVAARGLDIPDVEVVLNYSFPLTTEDYVHRIGRTGRAGKKGIAHTFFCPSMDKPRAGELINVLREAGQKVPEELLKFGTAVKKKESKLYGAHFKDVDISAKATKKTFDSDDD
ncbi:P-loop containing nucleoside triphosphate hydrolase protein [Dunaliella salina]|uniref:RNA helicase n=1 Tax=Dunaliella salina TaxID=3046 RepID=A0ABQ7GF09_DUNSA|nr:P-loop containing nucleoside triphosphate hydrolase protein [Dunaliella salina]|eukprot:KAF5833186.1 P-loop containing nucleoside triphosphate hydrolase protein [Dunaliella salina]